MKKKANDRKNSDPLPHEPEKEEMEMSGEKSEKMEHPEADEKQKITELEAKYDAEHPASEDKAEDAPAAEEMEHEPRKGMAQSKKTMGSEKSGVIKKRSHAKGAATGKRKDMHH